MSNAIRNIKKVDLNVNFGPEGSVIPDSTLDLHVQANKYEVEKFQKAISEVILNLESK